MNKYKKNFKYLSKIVLCFLGFALAKSFAEDKTKGFTFLSIDRHIPYDPTLTTSPDFDNQETVFAQPFYFLDRGGQSYVLISHDRQTVIKFFKKQYNIPDSFILALDKRLPSFLKPYRFEFLKTRKERFYPIFESCQLALDHLKEETALLYLHFNPTNHLPPLTVVDNLGIHHTLNLNTTSFLVQKYGERIFTRLEADLAKQDIAHAKKLIHNIVSYIEARSKKGIRDNDNGLRRNYGYRDDEAISLDVGAFSFDDSLKNSLESKQELERKTKQLGQWLADNYPDLLPYFEKEISLDIMQ